MARIALDVMGGDFAPRAPITGALHALEELDGSHIIQLVGQRSAIEAELKALFAGEFSHCASYRESLEIVEAPDTISMTDKPTAALKSRNPMAVGIGLQTSGDSDAFLSAGSTGAQMAASTMILKLQEGLRRPSVATILPTARLPLALLDSGAVVDASPTELLQFAWLGVAYAESVLGRSNPGVGLLNIGEERERGNQLAKAAHPLLASAAFNFVGNIEGRDIPAGMGHGAPIDVVICDGFVGNVVLKLYEAVMPMIVRLLNSELGIGREQVEASLGPLDTEEYGGAPLLGVKGVSIICHGNSSPRAMKNAVRVAVRAVETRMSDHVGERLLDAARSAPATATES